MVRPLQRQQEAFAHHIAMAWQDWAPQIRHRPQPFGELAPNFHRYEIDHGPSLDGKERTSHMTFGTRDKKIYVEYLKTHPDYRRDGIAEAMLRRLHKDFPGHRIVPGHMSEDGQAFHDQMLEREPEARQLVTAMAWTDWADKIEHFDGDGKDFSSMWPAAGGVYVIRHPGAGKPKDNSWTNWDEKNGAFSALAYSVHPHEPEVRVQLIATHPEHQRDGVAEALMRRLHDDYPDRRINPGYMTNPGKSFHNRMVRDVPEARELVTAAAAIHQAESLLNGPDQAYDEQGWLQRHQDHPPVEDDTDEIWYHVSPHALPVGTVLAPNHGTTPWDDNPYHGGLDNRANWTWVEHDEAKAKAWMHWVLDHQPECHLYRVTPHLGPYAWNGTADEGWVTDSATVEEELPVVGQDKTAAKVPHGVTIHHQDDDWLAHHNGREVGSLSVDYTTDPPSVDSVRVHPDYRRKGIGTALWEAAGRPAHTADDMSEDGRAWARSVGGDFVTASALRQVNPTLALARYALLDSEYLSGQEGIIGFLVWCIHTHQRLDRRALEDYAQQTNVSLQDYIDLGRFLDDATNSLMGDADWGHTAARTAMPVPRSVPAGPGTWKKQRDKLNEKAQKAGVPVKLVPNFSMDANDFAEQVYDQNWDWQGLRGGRGSWYADPIEYEGKGKPGIAYRQKIVNKGEGDREIPINYLLHHGDDGQINGILCHFPKGTPYEKPGAITVTVHPAHRDKGIGSALVNAAQEKFGIDLDQQEYTPLGYELYRNVKHQQGEEVPNIFNEKVSSALLFATRLLGEYGATPGC